jgi:exosortase/archaeosortase family protein
MERTIIKEKPFFRHALVIGLLASIFCGLLALGYTWDLTARAAKMILDQANIRTYYFAPSYLVYVRLLDGSVVGFQILIECSGLLTVAIFSFIYVFTIGLLRGSLKTKLTWFILSMCVGLLWNVNRLAFVIAIAYRFGLDAFFFVHYILSPSIDFIWIVSMWVQAMSRLGSKKKMEAP